MKYLLEIRIRTDGDFHFPFVPVGMQYDGDEEYDFTKEYKDRNEAINDVVNICAFLQEHIHTDNAYVRDYWNTAVNYFVNRLRASKEKIGEYVYSFMDGNYSGTEFIFHAIPNEYRFEMMLTDEEYELIKKNGSNINMGTIHDAVMSLFKEVK